MAIKNKLLHLHNNLNEMTKIQLSNYIISLEDDKIVLSNVALTWRVEISVANERFLILSYMINNPEMHKILEAYCYCNHITIDNTFIDEAYITEFTKNYNDCAKRFNDKMKVAQKEQKKVKTPKAK